MKNLAFNKQQLPFAFILTLIFLAGGSLFAQGQNTPEFDRLKATFEDGQILHADFSHRYEDSFTGEVQSSEGEIWIGKEQYKIEGSGQIMVVDGDISRVYDSSKNRVIISDYIEEEDDFAPSRMLQGVDESYVVEESATGDGQTEIILVSDDPFSIFERVTILLNQSGMPVEILAIDQAENRLITRFSNGSFTTPSDQLFQIDPPEDAEQIDLRYNSQ
ncbi:outer membrane lipoprotein carrier protein LolA [Rhodohalobacter sp. SW132]|uniref:LolA family protein n=1 Tax=Rhodohalobacter sp. SW132 TaxID=2293433 RepID=UPI000E279AF4|nr:outer-membrane lipoprotein carrier protein LolA [Rhodohalobacter sp. SW132]REL38750.1 outer membrane lipoprotein carrier protein LolA [Rhodohalobacter sp. SW132]